MNAVLEALTIEARAVDGRVHVHLFVGRREVPYTSARHQAFIRFSQGDIDTTVRDVLVEIGAWAVPTELPSHLAFHTNVRLRAQVERQRVTLPTEAGLQRALTDPGTPIAATCRVPAFRSAPLAALHRKTMRWWREWLTEQFLANKEVNIQSACDALVPRVWAEASRDPALQAVVEVTPHRLVPLVPLQEEDAVWSIERLHLANDGRTAPALIFDPEGALHMAIGLFARGTSAEEIKDRVRPTPVVAKLIEDLALLKAWQTTDIVAPVATPGRVLEAEGFRLLVDPVWKMADEPLRLRPVHAVLFTSPSPGLHQLLLTDRSLPVWVPRSNTPDLASDPSIWLRRCGFTDVRELCAPTSIGPFAISATAQAHPWDLAGHLKVTANGVDIPQRANEMPLLARGWPSLLAPPEEWFVQVR